MKTSTNLLIALIASIPASWAGNAVLHPDASTRVTRALVASSNSGEVSLPVREIQVDVTFSGGQTGRGRLEVLFASATGRFIWNLTATPGEYRLRAGESVFQASRVYVSSDRLVTFDCSVTDLVVRESGDKASTLDEAESKSIVLASERLHSDALTIPWSKIDWNLIYNPMSAAPGHIELLEVSHPDGNWELVLKGQWKARVTLSDKYQLLWSKRVE